MKAFIACNIRYFRTNIKNNTKQDWIIFYSTAFLYSSLSNKLTSFIWICIWYNVLNPSEKFLKNIFFMFVPQFDED